MKNNNIYLILLTLFFTISFNAQDGRDQPYTIENYLATLDINDKSCFLNGINTNWSLKPSLLGTQFPEDFDQQILNQQALPNVNEVLNMEMHEIQFNYLYGWNNVLNESLEWQGVVGRGSLSTENSFFENVIKYIRVSRIDNENLGDSYQIHYAWYIDSVDQPILEITHLIKLIGNSSLILKKVTDNTSNIPVESILRLSPNPANDYVTITLEESLKESSTIKIINVYGTLIKEVSGRSFSEKEILIDLKHFNVGTYFVEIYKNNLKLEVKTLIVNK